MAHSLRTMHEREGPTSLSVVQLVATDFLAPHLHSDERCKDEQKRHAHGDMECLALSLTSHIAKKHGLDQETIDSKLSAYGTSIASMLTSHLKQQGVSGTSQFRKNGQTNRAHKQGALCAVKVIALGHNPKQSAALRDDGNALCEASS